MVQNQLLNNVIENRTDFPAGPVEGQAIYRTDLNVFYIWDGTAWIDYEPNTFNSDDFTVAAGAVSLKNKTSYAAISAYGFIMQDAETDAGTYADASLENTAGSTKNCYASIQLPHGAVVTSAIVIATGGTWYLSRSNDEDPPDVMASAAAEVADGTINHATIDNNNHSYNFRISLPAGQYLTAARVTYTTDYD